MRNEHARLSSRTAKFRQRTARTRLRSALLLVGAAALVAGCGPNYPPSGNTSSTTSVPKSSVTQTAGQPTGHLSPATVVVFRPPTTAASIEPPQGVFFTLSLPYVPSGHALSHARTIPLQADLSASGPYTLLSPLQVTVAAAPGNPHSFRSTYSVKTGSQPVIGKGTNQERTIAIPIPVPPFSGRYVLSARARFRHGWFSHTTIGSLPLLVYVDHGGYYRRGSISVHASTSQNGLVYTVTKLTFTPTQTSAQFELAVPGHRPEHDLPALQYGFSAIEAVNQRVPKSKLQSVMPPNSLSGNTLALPSTTIQRVAVGPPTSINAKFLIVWTGAEPLTHSTHWHPVAIEVPLAGSHS